MSDPGSRDDHIGGSNGARSLREEDCIVVDKPALIRAQIGAGVGNFIEWYDVGVYGYLAVTLSKVFTEGMDEKVGLLVTLLGFAVSFLVRPLGGIILGPLGDKIGRRKVMLFTIGLMAVATTVIGVLPGAGQIGVWAVVLLYLMRMAQGFSTGGEYAGAATYVAEFSPDRTRGFWTSLLNSGSQLGFAAGAGVVALTSGIATHFWGPDAMISGGWRVPFLLAFVLGIIAILLRNRVDESPSFEAAQQKTVEQAANPMFTRHKLPGVLKHYWPQVLIGIALIGADGASSYTLTSYMPTYLETQVGIASVHTAVATVVILILQALLLPVFARMSDKLGRRPVYLMAAVGNLVLLVPAFALMNFGSTWALYVALGLVMIPSTLFLCMNAAVMAELYPTASRYCAVGFVQNIATSLFGGTVPLVSQLLVELTGNTYAPAFYVMFFSLIALGAALFMRETASRPLRGSVPVVSTAGEARELVEGQDLDERLDTSTMLLAPLPKVDDRV
ncbi:MFS transporter [Saccharopolyspora sp. TS4A08]|uniref:MFS transporter n=1 Tax=Saccharopolyspora ipomoeae TaxID=3042027 RepID=A0ABT6PI34_9PSEU|nr:MFS transporter [Saccharopolyspora sp. TS4A08]MDI2027661.1 MFS transporter [Saccharopolyspora sp. TS4A08]